jgi:hypothetical protein
LPLLILPDFFALVVFDSAQHDNFYLKIYLYIETGKLIDFDQKHESRKCVAFLNNAKKFSSNLKKFVDKTLQKMLKLIRAIV